MKEGKKRLKDFTREEKLAYHREATAQWRERNPEYAETQRERRLARIAAETPEETAARRTKERAYQQANRERIAQRAREWRSRNPEKSQAANARYRAKDPEKVRKITNASAKKNYPKYKATMMAHNKKRRAQKKGAANSEVIHLIKLAERDGWKCHICGGRVTKKSWSMDHLIPLSKGGDHTYANVSLAHRSCNSSRNAGRLPAQLLLIG